MARRWVWREGGCGEKVGVVRRWVWREDGCGEKVGVARRWVWREDGVAGGVGWQVVRDGERRAIEDRMRWDGLGARAGAVRGGEMV